ncbi:MAG: hypothetical protein KDD62_04570 [Bdellovibrionales bacterium]|nr:hypothetical protein [Bdellovibrionales bacterium]
MGFFIGWKYFEESQRYSADYYAELARQREDEADKRRQAEKRRLREQAKQREKKKEIREQWRHESEHYQDQFESTYGNQDNAISGGVGGPSSAFEQYGADSKESYREDIARRYGTLYSSGSGKEAPKVNRLGLGTSHHQQVKRPQNVKHHSPLGPIGAHKKIPVGMELPGINKDNPNCRDGKGGSGNGGRGNGQGSGGGKLGRPF